MATPKKKPPTPRGSRKKTASKKAPTARAKRARPAVTIGVTPPDLAPGSAAARFDASVKTPATRPSPSALAKAPWLAQDRAYRVGYHMLTHGLSDHGHMELEMCNVPGALLGGASELLMHVASYVVDDGGKLSHGEVMLVDESPLAVVGFQRIKQGSKDTEHEADVLRVVLLR